mmetsp:Transcript_56275/g.64239  ORF Transcript_56275/g.64239 Transcript_56275/m.64239 type:complete len:103 (+) Transcript_56275:182-490(+)
MRNFVQQNFITLPTLVHREGGVGEYVQIPECIYDLYPYDDEVVSFWFILPLPEFLTFSFSKPAVSNFLFLIFIVRLMTRQKSRKQEKKTNSEKNEIEEEKKM